MGAFSDLDKEIDNGKDRVKDAKEDFDEWRRDDR